MAKDVEARIDVGSRNPQMSHRPGTMRSEGSYAEARRLQRRTSALAFPSGPAAVVTQPFSGATTPMESMIWLQWTMRIFSPTPHLVAFSQGVLFRLAALDLIRAGIVRIIAIGATCVAFALSLPRGHFA